MKRTICCILFFVLLSGCSKTDIYIDKALSLRKSLNTCSNFTFVCHITADYGNEIHNFSANCSVDSNGDMTFAVLSPETIKGISGKIQSGKGKITFDDAVLAFPILAEGELSPVSGPWLMCKSLLSGYISSSCEENGQIRVTLNDSYEEDALTVDVQLNEHNVPAYAEIIWQGRRILSLNVENFQIQ